MEGLIPYVFEARATFDQTMNQTRLLNHFSNNGGPHVEGSILFSDVVES